METRLLSVDEVTSSRKLRDQRRLRQAGTVEDPKQRKIWTSVPISNKTVNRVITDEFLRELAQQKGYDKWHLSTPATK